MSKETEEKEDMPFTECELTEKVKNLELELEIKEGELRMEQGNLNYATNQYYECRKRLEEEVKKAEKAQIEKEALHNLLIDIVERMMEKK